ncbi:adhesion G-protein coupled receptor D2 isoform X1 [Electrophorus electricus]|uniref:adhesion G-protein coupled receptor D2 isoform X1 n=1 Tax=Electrophorus electricus TaxID=8005 RepID=UPI0015D07D41|nr:adhesion G-protein coupled receptor D2 isoform X1 [Electrophorus electricus]XP_026879969.2 adhesion G-protein coupled receptor D2 isoform X1 [Electrophorus electricus]
MCGNTGKGASYCREQMRHRHSQLRFYGKMSPVLLMVILARTMIAVSSSPENSLKTQLLPDTAERCVVDLKDPRPRVFQTSETVFQLLNMSCSYSQAWSYCQRHFSSLTVPGLEDDEEGSKQLLTDANMHRPIWVSTTNRLAPTPPLSVVSSGLYFPVESQDGYARVEASFPSLPSVSVCVRAQFDPQHKKVSTLFSYAAPVFTNEFQLRGYVDKVKPQVLLALIVHGKHHSYKAWFTNDANWHHICVTWQKSDGFWAIYVDGVRRDSAAGKEVSRNIYGNGILILGQDQDSFGGNFTEPFVGNITDLNIWDISLDETQIRTIHDCSPALKRKPFFNWLDRNLTIHAVKEVPAKMFCPGLQRQPSREDEYCRTLYGWKGDEAQYKTISCSQTWPFICKTRKERYEKKKELEESQNTHPSPFMQHLINNGMSTGDVLDPSDPDESWDVSLQLLNVSERYLRESLEHLESRDMPTLVQMLSRVADLPPAANKSCSAAHALSQSFVSLVDALISQGTASQWQAVKEVVSGPMTVVQTLDRMVTKMSPLLLEDKHSVQIHCNNIRLQVQQKNVSETSGGSKFCGSDASHTSLDCISILPQSMQDLHYNGFRKVTLLNTWYNSLTPLMNGSKNVTVPPTITDGSLKFVETVLGSTVISSVVVGDGQRISLGVQFTLQHQIQNTSGVYYNPVCAFWDFTLMPQDGGGWSTVGCEVVSFQKESTTCYCNHTTNFALLLQIYDVQFSPENDKGLQILSFIGCGASLCGLSFTLIIFIAVGVPKSDRTTVHKNLIVALAAAQLLLILSYWATANQEICLLVTVLLHLFFLSSFCWMLVEGLLLWSKVVSVNVNEDRRMRFYYILGWGLPVVIVAVTLTVSLNRYKAEKYCWLNTESNIIWAFVGPVLFVLAVNSVVLCRVVMVTISSACRRAKMHAPSSASKPRPLDLTWAATRPVLILLPVLGLTWLCGILVHLSVVLAYLFIVLNAFQGMYIFFVYAVYSSEVQTAIKRIQEKRKALSFSNCSHPISSSQKTPGVSWVESLPPPSSPDSSSFSNITSSTASSLMFKNESFINDSLVNFSIKPASGNQVVQLMAFKPSGAHQ